MSKQKDLNKAVTLSINIDGKEYDQKLTYRGISSYESDPETGNFLELVSEISDLGSKKGNSRGPSTHSLLKIVLVSLQHHEKFKGMTVDDFGDLIDSNIRLARLISIATNVTFKFISVEESEPVAGEVPEEGKK